MSSEINISNNESKLLTATLEGDVALTRQLLHQGINPNCKDPSGRGPLLCFFPEIISLLLDHGALPNEQFNENGHTVLAGLCYANSIFESRGTDQAAVIKLLLEHGADVERGYSSSRETPLHHATAPMGKDNISVIKILLENKANPNAITIPSIPSHNFYQGAKTKGESPLHRAAAFCSEATIDLLLDYGGDTSQVDANGETPLSWACWHQRPKSLIEKLR